MVKPCLFRQVMTPLSLKSTSNPSSVMAWEPKQATSREASRAALCQSCKSLEICHSLSEVDASRVTQHGCLNLDCQSLVMQAHCLLRPHLGMVGVRIPLER